MIRKQIAAPVLDPVSLDEARVHLKVDMHDVEDSAIDEMIKAAVAEAGLYQNRAYVTQTWTFYPSLREVRRGYVSIPLPPLQSISDISYRTVAGAWVLLVENTDYFVDTVSEPGMVVFSDDLVLPRKADLWPVLPIKITAVVGYGAPEAVPANIRQAILWLIGHFFENREAVLVGAGATVLPYGVRNLLNRERVIPT